MNEIDKIKYAFKESSQLLIALGDEKRQAIILALLDNNACCKLRVNDLTGVTGLTRPAVSHHVKILKDAGIIDCERQGTRNYYYLAPSLAMFEQLDTLIQNVERVVRDGQQ
ncbi:ArsR/SmtB family transcription factor [Lactobacillaceae bacterium Melli_B3]